MQNQTMVKAIKSESKPMFRTWQVVILLTFLYFVVAMADQFKGMLVPNFKEAFSVNNTQIGYAMTASLFAYAIFQYVGGMIIERFNSYKKAVLLGFIIALVSIGLLLATDNYIFLIIGLFGMSAGMAMFNVTLNAVAIVLPVASTAVLLNFLGFTYGASATAIQKVGGTVLYNGASWQSFFIFMFVCSAVIFGIAFLTRMPQREVDKVEIKSEKVSMFSLLKNKMVLLYIGAFGFYLAAEYNVGGWFVNYMTESFNMNAESVSMYTALFFAAITVARLVGGFIADKLGHFKSVIIFAIMGAILSIVGVLMGQAGLIVLACSGLFYSLICPVLMTTVGKAFTANLSQITGLLWMWGTLVAMTINMVIGFLNDMIGSYYSYLTIGVCLVLTAVFVILIKKNIKFSNES